MARKIKYIMLFLLISVLFLEASENYTHIVISKYNLRMREKSSTKSKIITSIPSGGRVKVLHVNKKLYVINGKKGHWAKVVWKSHVGYVFDSYLKQISKLKVIPKGEIMYIKNNKNPVILRSQPTEDSHRVQLLHKGNSVYVYKGKEFEKNNSEGTWYYVGWLFDNGWVKSTNIERRNLKRKKIFRYLLNDKQYKFNINYNYHHLYLLKTKYYKMIDNYDYKECRIKPDNFNIKISLKKNDEIILLTKKGRLFQDKIKNIYFISDPNNEILTLGFDLYKNNKPGICFIEKHLTSEENKILPISLKKLDDPEVKKIWRNIESSKQKIRNIVDVSLTAEEKKSYDQNPIKFLKENFKIKFYKFRFMGNIYTLVKAKNISIRFFIIYRNDKYLYDNQGFFHQFYSVSNKLYMFEFEEMWGTGYYSDKITEVTNIPNK